MKYFIYLSLLMASAASLSAQSHIRGQVLDEQNLPVPGANIYFEGSFEGTTTDTLGRFDMHTGLEGKQVLLISFIGYHLYRQELTLTEDISEIKAILLKEAKDLGEVVITAGTFSAGEESKSAHMSTLDLATAGSGGFGDISAALTSLPGTSQSGDEGGLLVRGGERYETAVAIDGLVADDAFTAKMPSVPVRGRFSPMLFRGTVFSTGGYSAEYGQALSSVLILNTIGIPEKDELYLSTHTAGLLFSGTKKWERTSISSTTGYNNMKYLYKLMDSNIQWQKEPESFSENLVFRKKIGETGLLKAMAALGYDNSALIYRDLNKDRDLSYSMENQNIFALVSYKEQLGEEWIIHSGLSLGVNDVDMGIDDTASYMKHKNSGEIKLAFKGPLSASVDLNVGGSLFLKDLAHIYQSGLGSNTFEADIFCPILGLYAETELKLSKRIASRIGARFETLPYTNESYLSPRFAMAYKLSPDIQLSLSYGSFSQQAQDDFLVYNNALKSEHADHLIANFQYKRNSRIFRVEGYYKVYEQLVKYDSLYATDASSYNNSGNGYAKGVDVFYRDSKSVRNADFWISYSWMDSQRDYKDYTCALVPAYLSAHNLSLNYKQYIELTDSYLSLGYTCASGRPYVDPNISLQEQQWTRPIHDLGLSVFHFTELFGKFFMFYARVSNVLGTDNVYGFRFATIPDATGLYRSEAVLPVSRRFFMLGIHLSFNGQTSI
jgi:CarboxypepD_reg-like domain/TonB dependent receptor-like, beta-barrel